MDGSGLVRAEDGIHFSASLAQTRFWLLEELDVGGAALNVAVQWKLLGALTPGQVEGAWRRVIDRHEVLRTGLTAIDGLPIQVLHPNAPFCLTHHDLRELSEAERLLAVERLGRAEAVTPFILAAPPLMRVSLLTLTPSVSHMLVTLHHAVCDGWSIGVLAEEFMSALEGAVLPALMLQYGDYAEWQRAWLASPALSLSKAYWVQQLADLPYGMVPADYSSTRRGSGAIVSALLPNSSAADLVRLASKHGCTVFTIALAALGCMLQVRIGRDDIAIGTQVANRDEIELESMVGCFINTVVLRLDLSLISNWGNFISHTAAVVSEALHHGQFPFEMLIQTLNPKRDHGRTPLYSVNMIFQRSFVRPAPRANVHLFDMPSYSAGALYDLNFFMVERPDGWRVSCEYDAARYRASTVQAMLDDWIAALTGKPCISNPTMQIAAHLSEIWQEVLGLDKASPSDDFFEVGGHSLLAARLLSRIEVAFGCRVTMADLFSEPTLGGLARRLEKLTSSADNPAISKPCRAHSRVIGLGDTNQWQPLADAISPSIRFTTLELAFASENIALYSEDYLILVANGPDAPAAISLASSLYKERQTVILALIDAAASTRLGIMSWLRRVASRPKFSGRVMLFGQADQSVKPACWSGQLTGSIEVIPLPATSRYSAIAQYIQATIV